jgi:lipoprotein signal peptidase
MKQASKQDLKIAALAWASIAVMFGFIAILDWAVLDWKKWFSFVAWTAFLWGCLAFGFLDDLKKLRCLLVFMISLAIYTTCWLLVQSSGTRVRDLYYMILSPFEAGLGAFILISVGGARGKKHHRRPPIDTGPR